MVAPIKIHFWWLMMICSCLKLSKYSHHTCLIFNYLLIGTITISLNEVFVLHFFSSIHSHFFQNKHCKWFMLCYYPIENSCVFSCFKLISTVWVVFFLYSLSEHWAVCAKHCQVIHVVCERKKNGMLVVWIAY